MNELGDDDIIEEEVYMMAYFPDLIDKNLFFRAKSPDNPMENYIGPNVSAPNATATISKSILSTLSSYPNSIPVELNNVHSSNVECILNDKIVFEGKHEINCGTMLFFEEERIKGDGVLPSKSQLNPFPHMSINSIPLSLSGYNYSEEEKQILANEVLKISQSGKSGGSSTMPKKNQVIRNLDNEPIEATKNTALEPVAQEEVGDGSMEIDS